jgi:hypothetical protein
VRILVAFGTRPEIIKLGPVCRALRRKRRMTMDLFWTGQHLELAAGHCQLNGPRAPFSGPARLERGSTIGEQRSSPTRATAPPTRGAYHGRLS